MLSRFKNVILHAAGADNALTSSAIVTSQIFPGSSSTSQPSPLTSTHPTTGKRTDSKKTKYEYTRPAFLKLSTHDEILVSADHMVRPILVPRDISGLPWSTGYAETINSGKSKKNEDQASFCQGVIKVPRGHALDRISDTDVEQPIEALEIPYYYFGMFDGHAGPGAAVVAASQLHNIIRDRLTDVGHHLVNHGPFCESTVRGKNKGILWFPQASITNDSLIVGALEAAFEQMDTQIERDSRLEGVRGGCTVVVCLFILGKLFIANAGDSRAVLCRRNQEALPLSDDFTPESERDRVRQLAEDNPHLLGNEFTALEYARRPVRRDIGTKILYRGGHMTGWAYKIATEDDLRFPVVFGYGKRSRVLATIGVTRGFGDHDLTAHGSTIKIKPFLKSQPEVKVVDLRELDCGEDDVVVMGTDGLWDVTSNNTTATIVFNTVDQYPMSDPVRLKYRYISAAQDLVMHARGKYSDRNWKMADGSAATIDDISVFVIPIWPYKLETEKMGEVAAAATGSDTDAVNETVHFNGNSVHSTVEEPDVNDNSDSSVLNGEEVDLVVRPGLNLKTTVDTNIGSRSVDINIPNVYVTEVIDAAADLPVTDELVDDQCNNPKVTSH